MEKQFVAFKIGIINYCIDVMNVQEVVRENQITHMPNFPDFVEGVINLRGIITPILSIDKRLRYIGNNQVHKTSLSESTLNSNVLWKLIIITVDSITIALIVDVLDKMITVDDALVQSSEGLGMNASHKMIDGIIQYNDVIYTVLNPQYILDNSETELLSKNLK